MCGEIVQEHVTGLLGMFGWRGLTVGDFVERNDNSGIAAPRIIEEDTGDLLDTFDTKVVKERREVRVGQLNFLAIHRGSPAMRGMMGASRGGMTQSKKRFGNVARHGDVNVASSIIPGNCEPKVAGPGPVLGECMPGGKSIKEVISIRLGEEFDTKIVDGKGKSCASISVAPETRGLDN